MLVSNISTLYIPQRPRLTTQDLIEDRLYGQVNHEELRKAKSIVKNTIEPILTKTQDVLLRDMEYEEEDLYNRVELVKRIFESMPDKKLVFTIGWPPILEAMIDLNDEIQEEDSWPLEEIVALEQAIINSSDAYENAITIPGTNTLAIKNGTSRISIEQLNTLAAATRRINNHTSTGFSSTRVINLTDHGENFGDVNSATKWANVNWDLTGRARNFAIDPELEFTGTLQHENTHSNAGNMMDCTFYDPNISIPREGDFYLVEDDSPRAMLDEANAHLSEPALHAAMGRVTFDPQAASSTLSEVGRMLAELDSPKYRGAMTPRGQEITDRLKETHRWAWLTICSKK